MEQAGKLIIITGATVSGKDTVVAKLLKLHPNWIKVVTTTTRPPRVGEREGFDYHFISEKTFQEMKANNKFLKSVEYAGNHYGTTKAILDHVLQGQTLIWRIDASRASKINKLFDDFFGEKTANLLKTNTRVVYLKLPDTDTRQIHFLKRGMEQADISKRIKQDEIDWNLGGFKNVVINYEGQLDRTIQSVKAIIQAEGSF